MSEKQKLNDLIRKSVPIIPKPHRLALTEGVSHLTEEEFQELFHKIRTFKSFDGNNDPYHEHDFGKVSVNGIDYFWKIDYFNSDITYHDENGIRNLTIMLASEY